MNRLEIMAAIESCEAQVAGQLPGVACGRGRGYCQGGSGSGFTVPGQPVPNRSLLLLIGSDLVASAQSYRPSVCPVAQPPPRTREIVLPQARGLVCDTARKVGDTDRDRQYRLTPPVGSLFADVAFPGQEKPWQQSPRRRSCHQHIQVRLQVLSRHPRASCISAACLHTHKHGRILGQGESQKSG